MANIDRFRRARAKSLRSNTTESERILWRALRRVPVLESHFRRQVPIGPFIADFACLRAKLIIELDGGQHSEDGVSVRDEARTRWLAREGYRVIRFWNGELSQNLEGVLDTIYAALYGSLQSEAIALPTPPRSAGALRPSPSRGG